MIGQIGPLVEVGTLSNRRLGMHLIGGATGGLISGTLLGLAATLLAFVFGATPLLAATGLLSPITLILLGSSDLGFRLIPVFTGSRQTPGYWSCSFGPTWGMFAWGADLGNGLTTRVPHQVLLGLIALSTLTGHFLVAVLVMVIYGLARTGIVAWTIFKAGSTDVGEVCTVISRREVTTNDLVGGAALALGIAMALNTV